MSNVIDFLERMGADATLRAAGTEALAHELIASAVDAGLAAAILAGDDAVLRDRLAPGKFYGIQLDREKDPEEEREDDAEESSVRFTQRQA
ncbi:hypothetical protein [Luteibacter sp.]|uniref:hypothetical protein n=1 Tax=Luteibacter sp. TaxID=1886636 RepID=UPI002F420A60